MIKESKIYKKLPHGGNIYKIAEITSKSLKEIIDLSSSVNPLPLPKEIIQKIKDLLFLLDKYPDPESLSLKKTISEIYEIPLNTIICGNGSTELIYLTLQAFSFSSAIILEPTFIEYERACKINKISKIKHIFSLNKDKGLSQLENYLKKNFSNVVVFICNPNNPTGWLIEKERLFYLINKYSSVFFLVDEAFIEFGKEHSLIKEATKVKNLIIFRSLTKFYGLAGLRLGYGVSYANNIKILERYKIPWSINSIAQHFGIFILKNKDFFTNSLNFFTKEKQFFENNFRRLKINFFPSITNFYLFYLENGAEFTEYLFKKGILIRNCYNFYGLNENYLRVSIKMRKENEIFFKELENWLKASL